jgi:hypothetical protein
LDPCRTRAVANLPRRNLSSHGNDLADWLVAQDSGKYSGEMSECEVYVGVTDTTCMHLHQHLIGPGRGCGTSLICHELFTAGTAAAFINIRS